MRVLIVYLSRHGCTEHAATMLRDTLATEVTLLALERDGDVDLDPFDLVIVGGPIYYGRLPHPLQHFCQRHSEALLAKRLGLFICCLESGERASAQLREAFPAPLFAHATATAIVGGELNLERLNFLERFIVRTVAQIDHDITTLSQERIRRLAERLLAPR